MVDLERTIAIIFEGDDRTTAAFKSVNSGLGGFSDVVESAAGKLSVVTDQIINADLALTAMAVGGLAYAYAKSMEFESAAVELQKVLGRDQVEALERAKTAAMNLSDEYGASASKILLSIADFVQAGFEVEDAMELVKNAMDLAIAGNLEASQSSELLISSLKGFREPASEASRLIDILNEVSNNYATNVGELAIGMANLSPIARTMGFTMEETAGLVTPIIEVFRSGEEAAVALKTGLLKLVDDSKPVREALESIGVSQTDANGALRSGKDILFDVAEAFTTLDENTKLYVAQQLVGIHQAGRMVEVFDNLGLSTEITAVAMNSAGSAAREVAARLASAEVQVDRFREGFKNLAITIGDQFKAATTEAISGATEIEHVLRTMVDAGTFDPIFNLVNDFSTELGDLLRRIAANLPEAFEDVDFSGLIRAIRDLFGAFNDYLGDLDLTKPEDLAQALQNVVDIITGLVRITEGMADAFRPFAKQIGDFILEIAHGDEQAQKFAGEILAIAKLISSLGLEIVAVLGSMQKSGIDFEGIFNRLIGAAGTAVEGLKIYFSVMQQTFTALALLAYEILDIFNMGIGEAYIDEKINQLHQMQAEIEANIEKNRGNLIDFFNLMIHGSSTIEDATEKATGSMDKLGESASGVRVEVDGVVKWIGKIPDRKSTSFDLTGIEGVKANLLELGWDISQIPEEKLVELAAATDAASFHAAYLALEEEIPEARNVDVSAIADQSSIDATKGAIEKDIPDKKDVGVGVQPDSTGIANVKSQLDIATEDRTAKINIDVDELALEKVKGQISIIQSKIEWEAKLDIAEVEANAKILAAVADTLGAAFESSGDIISSAVSALADLSDEVFDLTGNRNFIKRVIESEMDIRERAMSATEALVATQIEYMNSKIAALERGDALIQIDGAGLQPHLEAFMWEILSAVQVRVNEEGHAMLFGL